MFGVDIQSSFGYLLLQVCIVIYQSQKYWSRFEADKQKDLSKCPSTFCSVYRPYCFYCP